MTSLSHVEGMIAARRQDSSTKRARVLSTVQEMLAEHTPITFASVARQAEVSTWLVYAPGVREAIEQARARQRDRVQPRSDSPRTPAAWPPTLPSPAPRSRDCAPNANSTNSSCSARSARRWTTSPRQTCSLESTS